MIYKTIDNKCLFDFPAWGKFVEHALSAPSLVPKSVRAVSSRRNDTGFFLTESIDAACKVAAQGWTEKTSEARKLSEPIVNRVTKLVEREEAIFSEEGISVDISRYLENEPDCWLNLEPVIKEGAGNKLIKILLNIGALGDVHAGTIQKRGLYIMALIEILEYSDHRVAVDIVSHALSGNGNGKTVTIKIPVKSCDQNLDIGRLLFATSHPSMLRRLIFSVRETVPDAELLRALYISRKGGGGVLSLSYQDKAGDYDLYIEKAEKRMNHWTEQDFERWLMDQLKAQGIKLAKK